MNRVIHVYQRSVDWGVIFYTRHDCLVFYTLFSVFVRKYNVQVLGLAIMYNHFHILIAAQYRAQIEQFVSVITSLFARYYNDDTGLGGAVFHKSFGSSVKYNDKDIRTAAGYLYNNHTNKKLCDKADEIRWNFLPYAHNKYPFSDPIVLNKSRKVLRRAIKLIDSLRKQELYLGYSFLRTIFKGLTPTEKEQVTDYIISSYSCIDFPTLECLYRSYDEMVYSFNANTFNEYDITESKDERQGDDRVYGQLARAIISSGKFSRLKEILTMSPDARLQLALELHAKTEAPFTSIGKYLHLTIQYNSAPKDHF
ncbi:MAG: transposase [Bacteroidales bacterium]|nr:transposase [Bacteroidales bacterium]